jgi:hypothetical protein
MRRETEVEYGRRDRKKKTMKVCMYCGEDIAVIPRKDQGSLVCTQCHGVLTFGNLNVWDWTEGEIELNFAAIGAMIAAHFLGERGEIVRLAALYTIAQGRLLWGVPVRDLLTHNEEKEEIGAHIS